MHKRYLVFLLFFITVIANAQVTSTSWWTWVNGDSTINNTGVYGIQGNSSVTNKPGARRYSVSWKDATGNLWMFGGQGYAASGGTGFLNDLWKYDPSINQWTWINGDYATGITPSYGTRGVATSTNKPGARYSSISWTDASGNMWLFGGYGFATDGLGYLNDLWKYNPSTNQWTWMKGDTTTNSIGAYGTQNISSPTNKPGARYGSISWADASGNLWLFGGYGYATAGSNDFNDLWKYNTSTNEWTWIKGSSTVNSAGIYGSIKIAADANTPGARRYSTGWSDNTGNLWLFGGYGYASGSGVNFINDLWKFNTNTNQWTWMNGDSTTNNAGMYGVQGTSSVSNKPGARYISTSVKDAAGNAWLIGGYGYAANDGGYLNDVWKYNMSSNEWTWVKGDNNANNYAVYGKQSTTTSYLPGARQSMLSWTDNADNIWMFGGHGYTVDGGSGYLNDLWKFGGVQNLLPLTITFVKAYTISNNVQVEWNVENAATINKFEIERSADGISFMKTGEKTKDINNGKAYTWVDIAPLENNNFYRIKLIEHSGNARYSQVVQVNFSNNKKGISISPNPMINQTINLQLINQTKGIYEVRMYNNIGRQVYKNKIQHQGGSSVYALQISNGFTHGLYHFEISNAAGATIKSVVVHP